MTKPIHCFFFILFLALHFRKLKIVNGCELGVQLLTDEEDLR